LWKKEKTIVEITSNIMFWFTKAISIMAILLSIAGIYITIKIRKKQWSTTDFPLRFMWWGGIVTSPFLLFTVWMFLNWPCWPINNTTCLFLVIGIMALANIVGLLCMESIPSPKINDRS
jgi:hypothetical protein